MPQPLSRVPRSLRAPASARRSRRPKSDDAAVQEVHLGLPPRLDVLQHRRLVAVARPRAAPRSRSAPPDRSRARSPAPRRPPCPRRRAARRAARSGGCSQTRAVREPGQRAERVRRRVEDHLAPLRPARVGDRVRRHPGARARVGEPLDLGDGAGLRLERPEASCRPCTSHCTTPGSTTLPAGNVVPRITRSTCRGEHLLVADPVLDGRDASRRRTRARSRRSRASVCIAFVATIPKSQGGSSAASAVARSRPTTSPAPRQPQAVAVDRVDVVARRGRTPRPRRRRASPRFAANSEPTAPQPTMQTLITTTPPSP